jgi:hypothetical protein
MIWHAAHEILETKCNPHRKDAAPPTASLKKGAGAHWMQGKWIRRISPSVREWLTFLCFESLWKHASQASQPEAARQSLSKALCAQLSSHPWQARSVSAADWLCTAREGYFGLYFRFREPCSTILFGVPLPLLTPQGAGIGNSGIYARDRDSMAAQDNPQDKRHIRQTYSGRSARVASRPESQAAPPHNSNFRDDCHLPVMIRLTGGYSR